MNQHHDHLDDELIDLGAATTETKGSVPPYLDQEGGIRATPGLGLSAD